MKLSEIVNIIDTEPYYIDEYGIIYCADCRDILPKIPENSIDMILTDPPYGLNDNKNNKTKMSSKAGGVVNFSEDWDLEYPYWAIFYYFYLLKEKTNAVSFCPREKVSFIDKMFIRKGLKVKNHLYWYRRRGGVNPRHNFINGIEMAVWGVKGKNYTWNGGATTKNVFVEEFCELHYPPNNIHPTQKPTRLMSWIIQLLSNNNDIILDPFLGSGTTAVAAKQLGRKYIGIEISEEYCAMAKERLKQRELFT